MGKLYTGSPLANDFPRDITAIYSYLFNWENIPAVMELNASFNLISGRLLRKHNMYSTAIAPK